MNKLLLPAIIGMLLVGCGEKKDPEPMSPQTPAEQTMPRPSEPSNMDREPNRQSNMSPGSAATAGTSSTSGSSVSTGSAATSDSSAATNGGEVEAEKSDPRTSAQVNRDATGATADDSGTTLPNESNKQPD